MIIIPFLGTFVVFGAFAAGLGWRTKTYGPLMAGGMFVGIPLLTTVAFSSLLSLAVLLPLGVAALAMGYRRGRSAYWMGMLRRGAPDPMRRDEDAAWIAGGTPGSSTGGSSDSTGSSSSSDFGGGSSGGGGASGRW
jgi:uncharacterized membrane protein YgcG